MENITIIEIDDTRGNTIEHAVIDRGNGEMTIMLKSVYDEQQAALAEK
jgi:hypothetical protein